MTRNEALDALKEGGREAIKSLFLMLRTNELGEAPKLAIEQFTRGVKNLRDDLAAAVPIINEAFPEQEL